MGILKNIGSSILGLKGETPSTREGANPKSELHAQEPYPPGNMKQEHSVHDLNGLSPKKYQNPEKE